MMTVPLKRNSSRKTAGKTNWPAWAPRLPDIQSRLREVSARPKRRAGVSSLAAPAAPAGRGVRHDTKQRCLQAGLQGRQVFLETRHGRIDAVGHPAGQLQAAGSNRFRRQQGVAGTAQAHADDQDHRQAEVNRQIIAALVCAQRYAEAATPSTMTTSASCRAAAQAAGSAQSR